MKIEVSKKDLIWSYVGYFFTLFTNILLLPFVMSFVPSDELGLWYTFLSIGHLTTILDSTFAGSIYRNITYACSGVKEIRTEGYCEIREDGSDYRLLISIIRTCQKIYSAVSLVALVFLLSIGSMYLSKSAEIVIHRKWLFAWIIYALSVYLNLLYSYWVTAMRGAGAIQQSQKSNVLAKIMQIGVSLIGLFLGGGIIAMSIGYLASGFVLRIYGKHQLMKYNGIGLAYEKYKSIIPTGEIRDNFRKIWFNAKKSGLVGLGSFTITQTTTLVCSAWFGLEETASYGLSLQIITAVAGVARIYFEAVKPKLIGMRVADSIRSIKFKKEVSLAICIYWCVFLVEMLALTAIGMPLIKLIKTDVSLPLAMVVFMGIYLFLENNHAIFCTIIEMSNVVPYVKSSLISAVCIVVGEIVIASTTGVGIYGLMGVQFLVQLCYNNWHWPIIAMKDMEVSTVDIIRLGIAEGKTKLKCVMSRRKQQ